MPGISNTIGGDFDFLYKVCLLGDSGVGKTSLLRRFENQYLESSLPTIGVDVGVFSTEHCGKKVTLQVWDTAGQERFAALLPGFLRRAIGFIIVFDVTDAASFEHVGKWLQLAQAASPGARLFLVASKTDLLSRRVVAAEAAAEFAASNGMSYTETSARLGINTDALFDLLVEQLSAMPRLQCPVAPPTVKPAVAVSLDSTRTSTSCCGS